MANQGLSRMSEVLTSRTAVHEICVPEQDIALAAAEFHGSQISSSEMTLLKRPAAAP